MTDQGARRPVRADVPSSSGRSRSTWTSGRAIPRPPLAGIDQWLALVVSGAGPPCGPSARRSAVAAGQPLSPFLSIATAWPPSRCARPDPGTRRTEGIANASFHGSLFSGTVMNRFPFILTRRRTRSKTPRGNADRENRRPIPNSRGAVPALWGRAFPGGRRPCRRGPRAARRPRTRARHPPDRHHVVAGSGAARGVLASSDAPSGAEPARAAGAVRGVVGRQGWGVSP